MAEQFPVYVVDDDPGVRGWLSTFCEVEGLAFRGFASGEEFLASLEQLTPGCVLLDMRLPRMGGLDVMEALAARGSRLPVIGMTGYGDVDIAVGAMRLGAVEYLEKPFSCEALLEALDQAFDRLRSEAHAAR